jgi:hypothetical protein
MPVAIPKQPGRRDSLKFAIAVGLIVTYFPALFVAMTFWAPIAFVAIFLTYAIAMLLLRCSSCSWPLFKRGDWWVPWPWRACPQCAHRPTRQAPDNGGRPEAGTPKPPNTSLERTRDR